MQHKKILFIEICNFIDFPIGGYLSFAKQMVTAFNGQLLLVGLSSDDTPVGKWVKKEINGVTFDFFAVRKVVKSNRRTIIPQRLKSYIAVRKYRKEILSKEVDNVFIQTPEVLFALKKSGIKNICTRIPGVENPMSISRYWYGKYFAKLYDFLFYKTVNQSSVILASADKNAINNFIKRGKGVLPDDRVIQFPTRVDTSIFYPVKKENSRTILNLDQNQLIISTSGRLSKLKGWEFLLDCIKELKKYHPNCLLIFLGDGEDRLKIEEQIRIKNLTSNILLAGRVPHEKLSQYINASDMYVMGSYIEGWSTALVEAISCAKPIVCTNFSSAKELVLNDVNGFVIDDHDVDEFTEAMLRALNINKENLLGKSKEMERYSSDNLREAILHNWKLV